MSDTRTTEEIWELTGGRKLVKLLIYMSPFQEVFVTVRVEESGYFRREGIHVHTEADISLSQAILGGVIRVQGGNSIFILDC